jgi:hypothetical protein
MLDSIEKNKDAREGYLAIPEIILKKSNSEK